MNFGIVSAFSKGSGPGLDPGPGTLFKVCPSINKAGYGHFRLGNSKMYSLILVSLPLFEGFEEDIFFWPSPHAILKGPKFRATAKTKMEFFDQVSLCLGILERSTNVLVAEAITLYRK